jgi:hypothetical protein
VGRSQIAPETFSYKILAPDGLNQSAGLDLMLLEIITRWEILIRPIESF